MEPTLTLFTEQKSCLQRAIATLEPLLSTESPGTTSSLLHTAPVQANKSTSVAVCETVCQVHNNIINALASNDDSTTRMNKTLLMLQVTSSSEQKAVDIERIREYILLQADLLRTVRVTSQFLLPRALQVEDEQDGMMHDNRIVPPCKNCSRELQTTISRAELLLEILEDMYFSPYRSTANNNKRTPNGDADKSSSLGEVS